jgi:hypothetical protein
MVAAGIHRSCCLTVLPIQVVYGLDTSVAGMVNNHRTDLGTDSYRNQGSLKEIRSISWPRTEIRTAPTRSVATIDVGERFGTLLGRSFNLSTLSGRLAKLQMEGLYDCGETEKPNQVTLRAVIL